MQNKAQKNSYEILDVPLYADDQEIKLAYRRLVMFWHPDRRLHTPSIAEENLKLINEAYSNIKNKHSRARYNQVLRLQKKSKQYAVSGNAGLWGRFWTWMIKPVS